MIIKLDYEQWKWLRKLVEASVAIEKDSTSGELLLADNRVGLKIYEKIEITLPD